jgi:predicted lipoprotein
MLYKKTVIALSLASLILSGCGGSSSSKSEELIEPSQGFVFNADEMIINLTNDIIVSGYASLDLHAGTFHLATLTLLNTPTQANLVTAQKAWQAVRKPWEQGEAHIFGPVDALSIDPHLDTWPLNTHDLQTLLTTQSGFTADEISAWNDDVQGFHTMEFLLFGDGIEDNTKSIDEMTPLEREYLVATAEVFKGYAEQLHDAWVITQNPSVTNSPAYKDLLLSANNEIYTSQLAVIQELVNGMIGIVDEVGNGKIADPFGIDIKSIDTSKVESQYSWNSLADFADNIQGVENIYLGRFVEQNANKAGIYDFVYAGNPDLAMRLKVDIATAIEKIMAIAGDNNLPFRQAIKDADARVRIQTAIDALSIVQASFTDDVLPLLSKWQVN